MSSDKDQVIIRPNSSLQGRTKVPGDKSISHRAVLFGAMAQGKTEVRGWLAAGDTEASLRSIQALGIQVERHDTHTLSIHGGQLRASSEPLDLVNAGTGIRLLAGIMVGQPFASILDGSEQLRKRPMKRITAPLQMMQANIESTNDYAPLHIQPSQLQGIRYELPMASAQVKSAVLLAGLYAKGTTMVIEPGPARDHTERMLQAMGADLAIEENRVILNPSPTLNPMNITVPGDFSSAAFLIVAGLVIPDSDITITGVNLNPTRTGLLEVLQEMGANMTVTETGLEAGESVGEIRVQYTENLTATTVGGDLVVRMIDEFPILIVAALHANGETLVKDAKELRVKETDRIAVMATELRKLGAEITEYEDGFKIVGKQSLMGAVVDGHDDHRIAMSMIIAGLVADEQTIVTDAKCAGDSFPGFIETLEQLGGRFLQEELISS